MNRWLWGGASLLLLGSGCADRDGGALSTYGPDVPAAVLVEEMRIDGHEQTLVPIRGFVVREDGDLLIGQEDRVRAYSAEGTLVGTFGRRGEGPGEFETVTAMGLHGDSAWAFDALQRRLTMISPSLDVVRTVTMPATVTAVPEDVEEVPILLPVPVVLRPDGSFFATFLRVAGLPLPESVRDLEIGHVTADGELLRGLVRLPRGLTSVMIPGGGVRVPFPIRGHTAVSRYGDRLAGAFTSLEGEEASSFRVWVWNSEGELQWTQHYDFEPRPIPAAIADSINAEILERLSPQLTEAFQEQAVVPPVYPPLSNLTIGHDGAIWVGKRPRDGVRPYVVLDAAGEVMGTVVIPEEGRIMEAGAEQVWAVERDAFDVESVVRYRLEWE